MRNLLVLLIAIILSFSCSVEYETEHVVSIDVDSCLASGGVSIYDIFDKVELIQLDNSSPLSNSVYTGIANMTTDGSKFYILDGRSYEINVYDQSGRLICNADNVGRGPGEYTIASQIIYNSRLNSIEVLNPMGKILRYSCDSLKYESELNISGGPSATHYISQIDDDYFLYSHTDVEQLYMLSGNSMSVPLGYNPPIHLRNYMSASSGVFMLWDKPCVFRPYDGKVFYIDVADKSLRSLMEWDMGIYNSKFRHIPKYDDTRKYGDFILNYSQNHIAAFCSIDATGDQIFASVILKGDIYTLAYDLKDGTYHLFNRTVEGMDFMPELFYGNAMYKYVDCMSLIDFIDRNILDLQSQSVYDAIIREEGSAIIKYTLKR